MLRIDNSNKYTIYDPQTKDFGIEFHEYLANFEVLPNEPPHDFSFAMIFFMSLIPNRGANLIHVINRNVFVQTRKSKRVVHGGSSPTGVENVNRIIENNQMKRFLS